MLFRRCHLSVTALFVIGVFAVAAPPARASFTVLTNPNQFSSGSTLITFDEGDFNGHVLQPFDLVPSYRGVGFRGLGTSGTVPQAAFDPAPPREFGPGGTAGRTIIQVFFQGLEITPPGLVTQFGGEFQSVTPGDFTFTLFAGNQQVDVGTIPAGTTGQVYNFHAFEDSSAFDRVVIEGPGSGGLAGSVILDNLRFGPVAVPEPNTLALAGTGIVCLIGVAWRRRPRAAR